MTEPVNIDAMIAFIDKSITTSSKGTYKSTCNTLNSFGVDFDKLYSDPISVVKMLKEKGVLQHTCYTFIKTAKSIKKYIAKDVEFSAKFTDITNDVWNSYGKTIINHVYNEDITMMNDDHDEDASLETDVDDDERVNVEDVCDDHDEEDVQVPDEEPPSYAPINEEVSILRVEVKRLVSTLNAQGDRHQKEIKAIDNKVNEGFSILREEVKQLTSTLNAQEDRHQKEIKALEDQVNVVRVQAEQKQKCIVDLIAIIASGLNESAKGKVFDIWLSEKLTAI